MLDVVGVGIVFGYSDLTVFVGVLHVDVEFEIVLGLLVM